MVLQSCNKPAVSCKLIAVDPPSPYLTASFYQTWSVFCPWTFISELTSCVSTASKEIPPKITTCSCDFNLPLFGAAIFRCQSLAVFLTHLPGSLLPLLLRREPRTGWGDGLVRVTNTESLWAPLYLFVHITTVNFHAPYLTLHASQDAKKILACRGTELEERLCSCEEWYRSRLDQAVANNATGCLSSCICSDLCCAQLFLKWTDLSSSGEGWWGTPQVGVVIGMAWYVVTLATWHQLFPGRSK